MPKPIVLTANFQVTNVDISMQCVVGLFSVSVVGETTIARLFTPNERSKVYCKAIHSQRKKQCRQPQKGVQMNAGAECRVFVCRLLIHVVAPIVNRSAIFFYFLFLQSVLTTQMAHLCKKKI